MLRISKDFLTSFLLQFGLFKSLLLGGPLASRTLARATPARRWTAHETCKRSARTHNLKTQLTQLKTLQLTKGTSQ